MLLPALVSTPENYLLILNLGRYQPKTSNLQQCFLYYLLQYNLFKQTHLHNSTSRC